MILPIFHIFCAVLYAVLTVYVLIKNAREPLNQLCAAVLICFFIWCSGKSVAHFPGTPLALAELFRNVIIVGAWSFSTFLLLFSFVLTRRDRLLARPWVWLILFAVPVISVCLQWYDGRLLDYVSRSYGWGLHWRHGILSIVLLAYIFITTFIAALLALLHGVDVRDRREKKQSIIVAFCIFAGTIGGYATNYLGPLFGQDIPDLAQNFGVIWLGGLVYAIVRFHFMQPDQQAAATAIFSAIPDALFLTDTSGKITTVNGAGLVMLDQELPQVVGRKIGDIISCDRSDFLEYRVLQKGGDVKDCDGTIFRGKGGMVPVSLSISLVRNSNQHQKGLLVIARDIHERIDYQNSIQHSHSDLEIRVKERTEALNKLNSQLQAEIDRREASVQALAQSEEKFRLISEQSLLGIVILHHNRVAYANKAWQSITGFEVEEMMSWEPMDFIQQVHPEDRAFLMEQAQKKQAGETDFVECYQWRLITKSGQEKWLSMYSRPISYQGETADLATMVDITEQKAAMMLLKESEEKYRVLVENANDAIFIIQDGRVKFVNSKGCEMTGYRVEQLLESPFERYIHPDDRQTVIQKYTQRPTGKKLSTTLTFQGLHKSGESFWVQTNAVWFKWHGRPAILSLARDLTHQKKIESMVNHMQRLEAIGSMAGGIAHDFNNVLSPILGYAEILLDDLEKHPEMANHAQQIVKAAERARDLVYQILSLSHHKKVDQQDVELSALLSETITLSRAILPQHIIIDERIECQGIVTADPTQIHQVIMNLVTNAHQAMKAQGGTLRVSLSRTTSCPFVTEPGKSYLVIGIEDNGVGMDQKSIERIYEPYFSTKEHGSGLGLPVTLAILKDLGGHIDVDSQPDRGSRFSVYLPESEAQTTEELAETTTPSQRQPAEHATIMVIDDEIQILELFEKLFSRRGYSVRSYSDGKQALEAFSEHPDEIDLVITDMSMPTISGDQVARRVINVRPDMPVIVCTGYNERFSAEQAEELGVREYLLKPISPKVMLDKVAQLLQTA